MSPHHHPTSCTSLGGPSRPSDSTTIAPSPTFWTLDMRTPIIAAVALLLLGACSEKPAPVVPCESDSNCNVHPGGQCIASPTGADQCAYPSTTCPSRMAFGELTGDLAGTCAAAAFDVAFIREWRFSISGPVVGGVLQIINTSSEPLSLSTLQVSASDDHNVATAGVHITEETTLRALLLAPGTATQIVSVAGTPPLSTEPVANETVFFWLDVLDLPGGPLQSTFDITAQISITLDGAAVTLPVTLHMVSGLDPVVVADAEAGARVSAFR